MTEETKEKLAAVLIRGLIGIRKEIKDTLFMLKLRKKHACVVLANNAVNRGMLKKVKDYVAYGTISQEVEKELVEKRGEGKFYALHPPRGGFGRKGIKVPFNSGGALGDRNDKMDDLLKRMI